MSASEEGPGPMDAHKLPDMVNLETHQTPRRSPSPAQAAVGMHRGADLQKTPAEPEHMTHQKNCSPGMSSKCLHTVLTCSMARRMRCCLAIPLQAALNLQRVPVLLLQAWQARGHGVLHQRVLHLGVDLRRPCGHCYVGDGLPLVGHRGQGNTCSGLPGLVAGGHGCRIGPALSLEQPPRHQNMQTAYKLRRTALYVSLALRARLTLAAGSHSAAAAQHPITGCSPAIDWRPKIDMSRRPLPLLRMSAPTCKDGRPLINHWGCSSCCCSLALTPLL